eukprot:CAMPEP_0206568654 /NCGR_PEP_ID=MMETSP0325_2-20121206/25958_1 /ASSEMBLY_ACC=CAM_ASM_000347 /TAXON_ID=2866 /ORGANISM="Crypthecodinium cohnii, Strain Seligo" /LENGTH=227 /DNA_ID=CAMNT_0054072067 /DNA_START=178 /DNA_END=857 /DNA_ORIENTATION=-
MAFVCGPECCNANNDDTVPVAGKPVQADPTREAVEDRPVKGIETSTGTAAAAVKEAAAAPPKLEPPKALPTAEGTPITQSPALAASPAPTPTKITTWVYKPFNDKVIDIRRRATLSVDKEEKAGFRMAPDEVFEVSEEVKATEEGEEVLFLKLADGRGWVFDKRPRKGMMCIRQEDLHKLPPPAAPAPALAPAQAPPQQQEAPATAQGETQEGSPADPVEPSKKDKG